MGRSDYHHGNLRATLLTEGMAVAAAAGPSALTLRDLAKRAQVSPSAAYRHFPDLDHLVAEVARGARQRLATRMIHARDTVCAPGTPDERAIARFRAIGTEYVVFAVEESALFATAFVACNAPPAEPDDPSAWEVLLHSLQDLAGERLLPAEDLDHAALIAWSGVHGLAGILTQHPPTPSADENLTPPGMVAADGVLAAAEVVVDGILRAIGVAR